MTPLQGAVARTHNAAIYQMTDGGLDRLVMKGTAAPGLPGGATFSAFTSAAGNCNEWVAFTAKVVGTGVTTANDTGVWLWDGTDLISVAREGDAAPGTGGATWRGFTALAQPDNGRPVLVGMLNVGTGSPLTTLSTDRALWSLDDSGSVQLLVREGVTTVAGKTVASFKVLENVAGSPAQTRSHNGAGRLVYYARFTDGTDGIVPVELP